MFSCLLPPRDERSGIAAAQIRHVVPVDSAFVAAKTECEFERAAQEYPYVRVWTRIAVKQPEVLDEIRAEQVCTTRTALHLGCRKAGFSLLSRQDSGYSEQERPRSADSFGPDSLLSRCSGRSAARSVKTCAEAFRYHLPLKSGHNRSE